MTTFEKCLLTNFNHMAKKKIGWGHRPLCFWIESPQPTGYRISLFVFLNHSINDNNNDNTQAALSSFDDNNAIY